MASHHTQLQVVEVPNVTNGCALASTITPGTSQDGVISAGGLLRSYRIHIPIGYLPNHPVPLILNFHGRGGNMTAQEKLTGMAPLSDKYDFITIALQGTRDRIGLAGWSTYGAWNPRVNDLSFVNDLLTATENHFCIDARRVYAMGFSNGGGMVAMLACDMAGRLAAIATVSGAYHTLPGGCHPSDPISILEIHGDADLVVPYQGNVKRDEPPVQQWLAQWSVREDCQQPAVLLPQRGLVSGEIWGHCQNGVVIQHLRVHGEGHIWPTWAGDLITQFFYQHPATVA